MVSDEKPNSVSLLKTPKYHAGAPSQHFERWEEAPHLVYGFAAW